MNYSLISSSLLIVPAFLAGIYFKKFSEVRYFSLYLLISALFEGLFIATSRAGIHNWWLLDILVPVEFLLLGLTLSPFRKKITQLYVAGITAFLVAGAVESILPGLWNMRIQNMLLFILAGVYLLRLLDENLKQTVWQDFRFWMGCGLFLRFSSLCLIFTLTSFLNEKEQEDVAGTFSILLSCLNTVSYAIYTRAYLCKPAIL